jgi:DhnA family fructose-bisphosphate aldolase class Ia
MLSLGVVSGLTDMGWTINVVAMDGANAIVIHKGSIDSNCKRNGKRVRADTNSGLRLPPGTA